MDSPRSDSGRRPAEAIATRCWTNGRFGARFRFRDQPLGELRCLPAPMVVQCGKTARVSTCSRGLSGGANMQGRRLGALVLPVGLRCAAPMIVVLLATTASSLEASTLDTGDDHACAVTDKASVQCWGANKQHQLGNGGTESSPVPVDVRSLDEPITDVAAGLGFSCALTAAGGLQCWGANYLGQVGSGSDEPSITSPSEVVGLQSGVSSVAAGYRHACALTVAGEVHCWGSNESGSLGQVGLWQSNVPVRVEGLGPGVVAVDAYDQYSCAVTAEGGVKCWGWIPDEYEGGMHTVPQGVTGFSGAVLGVSVGIGYACATTDRGELACWGRVPTSGFIGTPRVVDGLPGSIVAVATGRYHVCALNEVGATYCWGENSIGQLGDGTLVNSAMPVPVMGLQAGVSSLTASHFHSCARLHAGGTHCWGWGGDGQIGLPWYRSVPRHVAVAPGQAMHVAPGYAHGCVSLGDGGVNCWGWNDVGQLGDGTSVPHPLPAPVQTFDAPIRALTAGRDQACVVNVSGEAWCWGDFGWTGSYVPAPIPGLEEVDALAAGLDHICARTTTGAAYCWGRGSFGQLGDGLSIGSVVPVPVFGLGTGVRQIVVGWNHSCALTDDGAVRCWGSNESGGVGDGTTEDRAVPTLVNLPAPAIAIAAQYQWSCALTVTGQVWCWGYRYPAPTRIDGLPAGITGIGAGGGHACAVTAEAGLKCWGDNEYGQLGHGTRTDEPSPPVDVVGLHAPVLSVSGGYNTTCATTVDGSAVCWGDIGLGLLGNGDAVYSPTPQPVVDVPVGLIFRSSFD